MNFVLNVENGKYVAVWSEGNIILLAGIMCTSRLHTMKEWAYPYKIPPM